ncbi:DMT family transporter [Fictibacillus iocasae]|uniref:DMT family transporter n=1 Tax=Fictibacillus iocasae TaxID=2715437 RepID=A0ABW2NYS3_9BACL
MELHRIKGFLLAIIGASLWGFSGNTAQYLFSEYAIQADWLVSVRMVSAGLLLLLLATFQKSRKDVLRIWKEQKSRTSLVIFSMAGMLSAQLTFFIAIEKGNAPTATLLQFLGPVFITLYFSLKMLKLPAKHEASAIAFALAGTFLLLTNGNVSKIAVPADAVLWGVLSGVAVAVYTVYPVQLLKQWPSAVIVGWSMVIGGSVLSLYTQPWNTAVPSSAAFWSLLLFVIVFGTLLPFYLYLDSLRYITSTETSLLGSAEPLVATFVSVLWLHTSFGLFQWAGAVFIILTVFLLSVPRTNTIRDSNTVHIN